MLNTCNRIIPSLNWLLGTITSLLLLLSAEHAVNKILPSVNSNNGAFHPSATKGKYPFETVPLLVILFLY